MFTRFHNRFLVAKQPPQLVQLCIRRVANFQPFLIGQQPPNAQPNRSNTQLRAANRCSREKGSMV